ncbi:MAG: DKNYY domain-containing protein [Crocinitomicaceae bacterium]|nr:DKNYY domain-containing protein [Crocinitomicaceae bacterium]
MHYSTPHSINSIIKFVIPKHAGVFFILVFTCLISLSSTAQDCQGSFDQQDVTGEEFPIDRPFRCGTGMMENQRYTERLEREGKGFFDIEGLEFFGVIGYFQKSGKVYYSSHPDSFFVVPNGDVASIEFVGTFVLDKKHVYSNGVAVEDVDVLTFKPLEGTPYAVDYKNVYYKGSREGSSFERVLVLEGANPFKFEMLCNELTNGYCYYYGKDDQHVYYSGVLIPGADAASFELITNGYAQDINFVYYNGQKLEGSSGSTLEIVDYIYAKDENNVYFYGETVPGMKGNKFKLLGDSGMGTDGELICYRTDVFPNGDPATLVDLGCGYYKDANNVYSKGQIWEGFDAGSFEVLQWGFTKDKYNVYCDDGIILGANPASFEVMGRKYSRDKKHVFYLRTLLEDCRRDSFVVDATDANIGEDAKATYLRGKRSVK